MPNARLWNGPTDYRVQGSYVDFRSIPGLYCWHDLSDATQRWQDLAKTTLASAESAPVAVVGDKSGLGRDLVNGGATDRPLLRLNAINGRAGVQFDGVNDAFTITNSQASARFLHSSNSTVFVVARSPSHILNTCAPAGGQIGYILYHTAATTCTLIGIRETGVLTNITSPATMPIDTWTAFATRMRYNTLTNPVAELFRNGTLQTSAASIPSPPSQAQSSWPMAIGYSPGLGTYATQWLAEIVIYSQALSTSDFNLVAGTLNSKYGLS